MARLPIVPPAPATSTRLRLQLVVVAPALNSNEAHSASTMQNIAQSSTEIPAREPEMEWLSELISRVAARGVAKLMIAGPGQRCLVPRVAGVGVNVVVSLVDVCDAICAGVTDVAAPDAPLMLASGQSLTPQLSRHCSIM